MGNANAAGDSSSESKEWSRLVRNARVLANQGELLISLFPSKRFSPSLGEVDKHHSKMVSVLADLKIDPGLSLDITTSDESSQSWDFNAHAMRVKAKKMLQEQAPELMVGSPMCTMYSSW